MLKGPNSPHIIVGTPGRILHLAKDKSLNLENLKMFILDECDKVLENVGKCCCLARLIYSNPHLYQITLILYVELIRYEKRYPANFQEDSSRKAGHDVHSYAVQRD